MPATKFTPALRLVNSSGSVIAGPLKLWLPDSETQGIYLESSTPRYAHELLGPYTNTAYTERWRLLGFRPEVDLVFSALRADLPGYALVLGYWSAALAGGTYAALQFNAFHDTCNVWRGMYPTTPWDPRPIAGKQGHGYSVTVSLRAAALIAAPATPGSFDAGTW